MILPLEDEIQRSVLTRRLLSIRRQFVNLVIVSRGCDGRGGGMAEGMTIDERGWNDILVRR